jgi:hypothetical protein
MIVMRNEISNIKNPKLPTHMPNSKPDRKHALSKNTLDTIKNLSDIVVYLWLKNGNSFWYYISYFQKRDSCEIGYRILLNFSWV